MSPGEQAARDAAIRARAEWIGGGVPEDQPVWRAAYEVATHDVDWWLSRGWSLTRTAPPPAAQEITQAQAREMYAALKWFIDDLSAPRSRMADFDANVARARAVIAGVSPHVG